MDECSRAVTYQKRNEMFGRMPKWTDGFSLPKPACQDLRPKRQIPLIESASRYDGPQGRKSLFVAHAPVTYRSRKTELVRLDEIAEPFTLNERGRCSLVILERCGPHFVPSCFPSFLQNAVFKRWSLYK